MTRLSLRRWNEDDLELLRLANTPAMTAHLNGPETEEQVADRHARYLRLGESGEARTFVIEEDGHPLGSIAYWQVDWRGEPALETGWFVLPEAQGRGVASAALALLIEDARAHRGDRRMLMACPGATNAASNGVCRRNGFSLVGTVSEEFRGGELVVNEWVLDLAAEGR